MHNMLTDKALKEMKEQHAADDRIWFLADLIAAEFESDQMSVQCFDGRIVKELISLVKRRKKMSDPFNPFKQVQPKNPAGE